MTAKFLPLAFLLLAACHGSNSTPDEPQETLTEAENVSRSVNDVAAAQEAATPIVEETAAPVQKVAPQSQSLAAADEDETEALPDGEESDEAD